MKESDGHGVVIMTPDVKERASPGFCYKFSNLAPNEWNMKGFKFEDNMVIVT